MTDVFKKYLQNSCSATIEKPWCKVDLVLSVIWFSFLIFIIHVIAFLQKRRNYSVLICVFVCVCCVFVCVCF